MGESLNFFDRISQSITQRFNLSEMSALQKMEDTLFPLEDTALDV